MPVYDTGLVNNINGLINTVSVSVSNTGTLPAIVGIEMYTVESSSQFSSTVIEFTSVVNLDPFGLVDSSFTAVIPTAVYTLFGVRILTSGQGAENIAIAVTKLDVSNSYLGLMPLELSPSPLCLYVATDAYVNVYDLSTDQLITNIPLSASQGTISINIIGTRAYVADTSGNIDVIQTSTNTIVTAITLPGTPFVTGAAVSPDLLTLYVLDADQTTPTNALFYVSTLTNTVTSSVALSSNPTAIAITPDGRYGYVTLGGASSVVVIDLALQTIAATIAVGVTPVSIVISPDGTTAYVSNQGSITISVISTATNIVTSTIALPGGGNTPGVIAISPDGTNLYVTIYNPTVSSIYIVNTLTNSIYKTVTDPSGTIFVSNDLITSIVPSADGTVVYVSLVLSNLIAAFDPLQATPVITSAFPTSSTPIAMDATPIFLDFPGLGS